MRSLGLVSGSRLFLADALAGLGCGAGTRRRQGGAGSSDAGDEAGGEAGGASAGWGRHCLHRPWGFGAKMAAAASSGAVSYGEVGWGSAEQRCSLSSLLRINVWANVAGTLDFSIPLALLPSDSLAVAHQQVAISRAKLCAA